MLCASYLSIRDYRFLSDTVNALISDVVVANLLMYSLPGMTLLTKVLDEIHITYHRAFIN